LKDIILIGKAPALQLREEGRRYLGGVLLSGKCSSGRSLLSLCIGLKKKKFSTALSRRKKGEKKEIAKDRARAFGL